MMTANQGKGEKTNRSGRRGRSVADAEITQGQQQRQLSRRDAGATKPTARAKPTVAVPRKLRRGFAGYGVCDAASKAPPFA
jgi:hypothetical protein